MKFSEWQVRTTDRAAIARLEAGGFSPLTAAVLCSRGYTDPEEAGAFLRADVPLIDPFAMRDMDKVVARLRKALDAHEKIAVFGDYDVDGITATTLLTDFLRRQGGDVLPYIPSRLEEGYGLNAIAIDSLSAAGVRLIVTVDCGITAVEEADLCRRKGIDLCITDHHECKDTLPNCIAVVDPHRKDRTYPHQNLSGVGVAFKLAAAISGDQASVLRDYCDLVCLGTIADVMNLVGENRVFVSRGLDALQNPKRVGLSALIRECGCDSQPVNAGTVGYILAPRINAAGRMGQVNIALDLFLTDDPALAEELSRQLCSLNRQRQSVEASIYRDAVAMLPPSGKPDAIVLSKRDWHQGVVGIVASRLSEEYCCPTFLICPDGNKGKASSRSYGGFNLFTALDSLSDLLEGYGGHELAAGFTILCENIDLFREKISALSAEYRKAGKSRNALQIDCEISPALLTNENVAALSELEPCGSGCPRPVFYMENLLVDQLSEVGGGKHLRLRLLKDSQLISAIFFSTTALRAGICEGDRVDIAFTPQINEFRGTRTVQLSLVDIRPCASHREISDADALLYSRYLDWQLEPRDAAELIPSRNEFVALWRYLSSQKAEQSLQETGDCLSRKVSRYANLPYRPCRTRICLDVFHELGLLQLQEHQQILEITLTSDGRKVDLERSIILKRLNKQKEV